VAAASARTDFRLIRSPQQLQRAGEGEEGPVLNGARRPLALTQDASHLCVAQPFDETQEHDLPLLFPKVAESLPQLVDLEPGL
jgi:hypothetical protein